ncbi:hypothetical protein C0J52_26671 [Blattella germanica]|nr:hypothetical protein C0J52_26671 [Blattella germanica]
MRTSVDSINEISLKHSKHYVGLTKFWKNNSVSARKTSLDIPTLIPPQLSLSTIAIDKVLQSTEMKFLKRTKCCTKLDDIRNEDIRTLLSQLRFAPKAKYDDGGMNQLRPGWGGSLDFSFTYSPAQESHNQQFSLVSSRKSQVVVLKIEMYATNIITA